MVACQQWPEWDGDDERWSGALRQLAQDAFAGSDNPTPVEHVGRLWLITGSVFVGTHMSFHLAEVQYNASDEPQYTGLTSEVAFTRNLYTQLPLGGTVNGD
jgi:hypothetical protein